jgi:hypothetical protein
MTQAEYQQFLLRTQKKPASVPNLDSVDRERDLHDDIIEFCNAQWPPWKFIHARMDKRSTIAVGAPDFTVCASGGRVFHIEVKGKTTKTSNEQLAWHKQMEMLGHQVHVVTSMSQFLEAVK